MPFTITWTQQGVVWKYSGRLTGSDLLTSNLQIFGDERFDELRYQIVDLSDVEEIDVSEAVMRKVAHLDMAAARTNPRVKVAVISTSDAAAQLNEFYQKYTDGKSPWKNRDFSSFEQAEAWATAP